MKNRKKTPKTIGNVKLIYCLAFHGKKSNARCAKTILFWGKKSMRGKEFSVYLINLSWKRFFMKEFQWKIFTNRNFADFAIKLLCISCSNSYSIKTNTAGRQLLNVHNYTFKFPPIYFFRLNWVGYLFHCNTGTFRKQSFL